MESLPKTLYHYTGQTGLLGIIKEESVWTTPIQYLNDASELTPAIELSETLLSERAESSQEKDNAICWPASKWHQIGDALREAGVFVFSLSENGDLLSQWHAYCP